MISLIDASRVMLSLVFLALVVLRLRAIFRDWKSVALRSRDLHDQPDPTSEPRRIEERAFSEVSRRTHDMVYPEPCGECPEDHTDGTAPVVVGGQGCFWRCQALNRNGRSVVRVSQLDCRGRIIGAPWHFEGSLSSVVESLLESAAY